MAIKAAPPTEKFKLGLGNPNLKGMPLKRQPFKPGQMITPNPGPKKKADKNKAKPKEAMKELEWKKKTPAFKSNVNAPLTGKHFDKNKDNPAEKAAQARIGDAVKDKKFKSENERKDFVAKVRGKELASINEENNLRAKPEHSMTKPQKFRLEQIQIRNSKNLGAPVHPELSGDYSRKGIDSNVKEQMDRSVRSPNPNDFGNKSTSSLSAAQKGSVSRGPVQRTQRTGGSQARRVR
jgi:hypothetical protein